jgi:hypothetical protein
VITLATVTVTIYLRGHLGWRDTDRIVSISCCVTQGGQGKCCFMSLSLTVSLTNFTNVNDPISFVMISLNIFVFRQYWSILTLVSYARVGDTTLSITKFSATTLSICVAILSVMLSYSYADCSLSISWVSLCWVSLCWVSLCWAPFSWVSSCWVSWHTELTQSNHLALKY